MCCLTQHKGSRFLSWPAVSFCLPCLFTHTCLIQLITFELFLMVAFCEYVVMNNWVKIPMCVYFLISVGYFIKWKKPIIKSVCHSNYVSHLTQSKFFFSFLDFFETMFLWETVLAVLYSQVLKHSRMVIAGVLGGKGKDAFQLQGEQEIVSQQWDNYPVQMSLPMVTMALKCHTLFLSLNFSHLPVRMLAKSSLSCVGSKVSVMVRRVRSEHFLLVSSSLLLYTVSWLAQLPVIPSKL